MVCSTCTLQVKWPTGCVWNGNEASKSFSASHPEKKLRNVQANHLLPVSLFFTRFSFSLSPSHPVVRCWLLILSRVFPFPASSLHPSLPFLSFSSLLPFFPPLIIVSLLFHRHIPILPSSFYHHHLISSRWISTFLSFFATPAFVAPTLSIFFSRLGSRDP